MSGAGKDKGQGKGSVNGSKEASKTSSKSSKTKGGKIMSEEKAAPKTTKKHNPKRAVMYDFRLEGWVTENEARDIREALSPNPDGTPFNRATITKWRQRGYIAGMRLHGSIWLVNRDDVESIPALPQGNPLARNSHRKEVFDAYMEGRKARRADDMKTKEVRLVNVGVYTGR